MAKTNWLLKLLGVDPEVKRQRADLKRNLDEVDARLDALQQQLQEVGQDASVENAAIHQTLIGLDDYHRTAQRS